MLAAVLTIMLDRLTEDRLADEFGPPRPVCRVPVSSEGFRDPHAEPPGRGRLNIKGTMQKHEVRQDVRCNARKKQCGYFDPCQQAQPTISMDWQIFASTSQQSELGDHLFRKLVGAVHVVASRDDDRQFVRGVVSLSHHLCAGLGR